MKTTKFLAMLMAAFALSFSFVSCGDDDEPKPANNSKGNVITVGNQSAVIATAAWERLDWNPDTELRYQCLEFRSAEGKLPEAMIRIGLWAITPDGVVPTGTFRTTSDGNSAVYGGGFVGDNNFHFDLNEKGNGSLVIKKEGSDYTVTIDPLIVEVDDKTVTTKFVYKGKIAVRESHFEGE